MRLGDIGRGPLGALLMAKVNKAQIGDAGVKIGGLRAALRPRPRVLGGGRGSVVRAGGGGGRAAEGTATAFFRAGGGCDMMSARGQFHSGGGPLLGGSVAVDGAGAVRWGRAEVGEKEAALYPPSPPEDGPAAEVPQTA